MKKKKIGIIGFGEMGKRHAKEFDESTGGMLELAGVYEPSDLNYQKGCEWNGFKPKRYESPEELIEKGKLDGVIITSPNCCHLENLLLLKGNKMAVLLEKPLESSLEKICEIARFAKKYKGPIIVDHVMRYAPIVRRGKQIIDDGLLGKVCALHFIQRHSGGALFQTFRRTLAGGGGQMVEKATHDLDVMLFWAGATPKRVASFGRQHLYKGNKPDDLCCSTCDEVMTCLNATHVGREDNPHLKDVANSNDLCAYAKCVDVPDNETCMIELDGGMFGTYSQCYFCETDYSREYEVIGTLGTMKVSFSGNPDGVLKFYPRGRGKNGEVQTYKFDYHGKIHYLGGPFVGRHFYDLICGKARPFTTVEQAFVAEMLSCAAMKAQDKNAFVNVVDIVPKDLKKTYNDTYAGK